MPEETKLALALMAPNGRIVERIMTHGWSNANIDMVGEWNPTTHTVGGTVTDYSCGDFPDMEKYDCHGDNLLSDSQGNPWLEEHCRLVTIKSEDGCIPFDMVDYVCSLHAWPEDVVAACVEAMNMHEALAGVDYMFNLLPPEMQRDDTVNACINTIIKGRPTDRLQRAEAIIKAYRLTQTLPGVPLLLDIDALTEEHDNAEA